MIQIQYPYKVKNAKTSKEDFNLEYYDVVRSFIEEDKLNIQLKLVCENLSFWKLITADFKELIDIKTKIEHSANIILINIFFKKGIDKIQFVYNLAQPSISEFLMKHNNEMNLKSCHYCNIDFINTFDEVHYHKSEIDILNNASKTLFNHIELTEHTINKIISQRKIQKFTNVNELVALLPTLYCKILKNIKKWSGVECMVKKNHFTLDHFMGKSDFPYLSLSLYNLVPSCSPCNTKFKHSKEFKIESSENSNLSPTSQNFSVGNDIGFNMFFYINEEDSTFNINKIKSKNDFKVKIQNNTLKEEIDEFIKIFKLQGRYNFHNDISFKLLEKRKNYSNSQIREIASITNRDILDVKKDIFGSVIFNDDENNEPFAKYKKDIAKQLGLI